MRFWRTRPLFQRLTEDGGSARFAGKQVMLTGIFNREKAVGPRKARNKSICFIDTVIHPTGNDLRLGISLNIFAPFVFFVDQSPFLAAYRTYFTPALRVKKCECKAEERDL